MQLTKAEVERFYAIWTPLILFVNRRLRLVPTMLSAGVDDPMDIREVVKIRDAMWADDSHREAFIAENPAGLPDEDLATVESWRHRRAGAFYCLRHLKKYSVFIGEKNQVYGVLGLTSPLEEVVPFVPCYLKAVLLPFDDRIIYDSLLASYNISFGPGIRSSLEQTYNDAKERGAIITSLLPPTAPASREEAVEAGRATNSKVLDAFRTYLYRSGLSPKVVERDLANITAFAEGYLLGRPNPQSLRDFGSDDLSGYLAHLRATPTIKEGQRKAALTSLKRLVKFLRDTDRMDHDVAEYALKSLKGGG